MKAGEFKKIADALARFATTRETATGPTSLIGVQSTNGNLKLISGETTAAMVVTVPEFNGIKEDIKWTIPARPLLQAAKVLPARHEITINVEADRLQLLTEGGGSVDIGRSAVPLREVGWPRKPRVFRASGRIDAINLKRMSKLFKNISAKVQVPSVRIIKDTGYAITVAPGVGAMYANYRFPAESVNGPDDEYNMAAYREFWEALTHFQDDGTLQWGRDGVLCRAGDYECYSAPYLVAKYDKKTGTSEAPREQDPWPIMVAIEQSDVALTIMRKTLTEVIKGQAPFDDLNRITLEVTTGSVRVMPFGSNDGMDVPCEATGKGIRSVNADYLLTLLNAMDSKEVTLRWSGGVPAISISSEDYSSWTILLAPITF